MGGSGGGGGGEVTMFKIHCTILKELIKYPKILLEVAK